MSKSSAVAIRPSQVFKAGPADELPSSLILRVKLVGTELWVLEWEPHTHKPGRTQVKDGEPTAQPKPEPLSPSTRAKLVDLGARWAMWGKERKKDLRPLPGVC